MKSVPLPRIGMRVVKTAVAVMLSYTTVSYTHLPRGRRAMDTVS